MGITGCRGRTCFYIHTKGVLPCHVGVGNLQLLDKDPSIRLCYFQAKHLHPNGTVRLDAESAGDIKLSMPGGGGSHL